MEARLGHRILRRFFSRLAPFSLLIFFSVLDGNFLWGKGGCQLTTDRLIEQVELRPENQILRGHLWECGPIYSPTLEVRSLYLQERENDIYSKEVTTQEESWAIAVTGAWPIARRDCSRWAFYLRGGGGEQMQSNLVTHADNYVIALYQVGGGFQYAFGGDSKKRNWVLSGDCLIKGGEGVRGLFPFSTAFRLEPNLLFRYLTCTGRGLVAAYLDSTAERDTLGGKSYLLERENLLARYEHLFCFPHRFFGVEGHLLHLDSPKNWEERASVWFQTGFPQVEQYLTFRYQFDFRHFDRTVFAYLSFDHRVAHSGIFSWVYPVWHHGCFWADYTYTWMRTRELNDPGQQTRSSGEIVPKIIFKQTLTTHRIRGRLEHQCGQHFCFFLAGSYYWDKFNYYAWRVRGGLRCLL